MSRASNEEEDNESLYMMHQAEFENVKCSTDEEEDDKSK